MKNRLFLALAGVLAGIFGLLYFNGVKKPGFDNFSVQASPESNPGVLKVVGELRGLLWLSAVKDTSTGTTCYITGGNNPFVYCVPEKD